MADLFQEQQGLTFQQQLGAEEYSDACLLYEYSLSPLRRPQVRSGISLCAAILLGSLIPWYSVRYATVYFPVTGILVFLSLALYFWREQPRRHRQNALDLYSSNRMLGLSMEISIYRDHFLLKNDYESWKEFWTDFSGCVEDPEYYVLWGGISRPLLVLKKSSLTSQQEEQLTLHFSNTFVGRYRCEMHRRSK